MKIKTEKNGILLENTSDFDISSTFDCGQCFRFDRLDENVYYGVAGGKEITVRQSGTDIFLEGITKQDLDCFWYDFFDLDRDYAKIREEISKIHPLLKKAAEFSPGIRILKQNSWEALCSFIISQQKQIPNIKLTVSKMSEIFGEKKGNAYDFPTAERLSLLNLSDIDFLKLGYRDRYVLSAAKAVSAGTVKLSEIKEMAVADARKELTKICGVGVKVADCTLLYGMQRLEICPVDTWMKKAEQLFPQGFPFLNSPYAGIAQQYLFHFMRTNRS